MTTQPDFLESDQWWARLQAGERTAFEDLFRYCVPLLTKWAVKNYANLPYELVEEVVQNVLFEFHRSLHRYDRHKAKITTYLINLLKWRLQDQLTAEGEPPENLLQFPYHKQVPPDPDTQRARDHLFDTASATCTPVEQAFLHLMRQGEKAQSAYLALLHQHGITENLTRTVANTKDRLRAHLKRTATHLGYHATDLFD